MANESKANESPTQTQAHQAPYSTKKTKRKVKAMPKFAKCTDSAVHHSPCGLVEALFSLFHFESVWISINSFFRFVPKESFHFHDEMAGRIWVWCAFARCSL